MRFARVALVLCAPLVCTLFTSPAAATPRREAQVLAQQHFANADRAFRAGAYDAAVAELRAGFELDPRPEYRVALAQAYRKAGRLHEAIRQCERYLADAGDSPLAPGVRRLAEKLRTEVARSSAGDDTVDATPPPPRATDATALAMRSSSSATAEMRTVFTSPPAGVERARDDDAPGKSGAGASADAGKAANTAAHPTAATPASAPAAHPILATAAPAPRRASWWSAHRHAATIAIVSVAAVVGVIVTVGVVGAEQSSSPHTTLGTVAF